MGKFNFVLMRLFVRIVIRFVMSSWDGWFFEGGISIFFEDKGIVGFLLLWLFSFRYVEVE